MQTETKADFTALQDVVTIANRAMKFKLKRGGTARRIRDKDAEALVKAQMGDEGQIVSRELFKSDAHPVRIYQKKSNEMYAYHLKSTLPYGDDSSRVLHNKKYFTYTSTMSNFISGLDTLRASIRANWATLVNDDILARTIELNKQRASNPGITGKMPCATDYPTAQQMEDKLYVVWFPEPINTVDDFRFTLPPEMLAVANKQMAEMVNQASQERFSRMLAPVSAFIGKLDKYKGDKGQKWYDSFLDNLAALPEEIDALNIVDDPVVDAFVQQISSIVAPYAHGQDVLKEDAYAREEMKKKLLALENSLKGYTF